MSFESDYDKKINREKWAEGERLFFSKKMKCNSCHTAPLFTNSAFEKSFFDENDKGFFEISKNPNDLGKFRVPTLRQVKLTAPYMHDGSIAELSQAIQHDFFDKNNKKANKIKMTQKEILALLAFLKTL